MIVLRILSKILRFKPILQLSIELKQFFLLTILNHIKFMFAEPPQIIISSFMYNFGLENGML